MKAARATRAAPAWRSPIRERPSGQPCAAGLSLAFRAVEGRAAALDDAPDRAAAGARLAFAVIDREVLGEIAELAVGLDEVAQGRAAGRDRLAEHRRDRRGQARRAGSRHLARRPCADRSAPGKRLADIDIAEPGDDPLVEQQQL